MIIDIIIPAYNEEQSIGLVVADACSMPVRHVVVANNGSTDGTPEVAALYGAHVVHEHKRGYGNACLAAMAWIATQDPAPDVIVFMDGDRSEDFSDFAAVCEPILSGRADLVIGSSELGVSSSPKN
jgi:glycosyltransferase involved in cell wall biosynthesis